MPQRQRVLFALPSLRGGGAERAVVNLLRHLDGKRFEPHLALLEAVGPYLRELPPGLEVHDLHARRVRYALPALVQILRKLRPQATVSSLIELNMAMAASAALCPSKLLLREDTLVGEQLGGRGRAVERALCRLLYARADSVVCVADYILNDLAVNFGIPRDKLARIYNPVDVERVRRLAIEGGNPYWDSNPRFIAAGRLERVKGFDILLAAMALVHRELPPAELVILGAGSLASDLKTQSRLLGIAGSVQFIGFQANPYNFMKFADVFVLASRYEGLPLVLLETMALGLPVAATKCPGGVQELLAKHPMAHGAPPEDAAALAGAMIASYRASRPRLPGAAPGPEFDAAVAPFEASRIARAYEQLLL